MGSRLLTTGNPKTAKGEGYGYLTAILHLAPHKLSGANLCASATPGCIAACLNKAGLHGPQASTQEARIRKSQWFRNDRDSFMQALERDIAAHVRRAHRNELEPCVRLNGTSDIPWEMVRYTRADGSHGTILDRFPAVQFYDYTKIAIRLKRALPANYDLTFSAADGNEEAVEFALKHGARVAVVFRNRRRPTLPGRFWNLPKTWRGKRIIDADKHDLRFLEPAGAICALKAKGPALKDTTGFTRLINPAVA